MFLHSYYYHLCSGPITDIRILQSRSVVHFQIKSTRSWRRSLQQILNLKFKYSKINRNWKFIIVTLNARVQDVKLAANVSANSRYVRGRHLYQTLHITFSCDHLQTVTSTHEGRWWWTCYKPTRLFCVNRNRVFYCLWCFLTRTRASAHRCDEREIENTT